MDFNLLSLTLIGRTQYPELRQHTSLGSPMCLGNLECEKQASGLLKLGLSCTLTCLRKLMCVCVCVCVFPIAQMWDIDKEGQCVSSAGKSWMGKLDSARGETKGRKPISRSYKGSSKKIPQYSAYVWVKETSGAEGN